MTMSMSLRQKNKIDYKALDSGDFYKMEGAYAQKMLFEKPNSESSDTDTDRESDLDTVVDIVEPPSVEELEEELKSLDLKEKQWKLQEEVAKKKADIAQYKKSVQSMDSTAKKKKRKNRRDKSKGLGRDNDPYNPYNTMPSYHPPPPHHITSGIQPPPHGPPLPPHTYQSSGYSPQQSSWGQRLDLNPQAYLYAPDSLPIGSKYRAIPDFIPKGARDSQEDFEEHEMSPGITLTINGRSKKSKLSSVTPAQWVAANACILADIVAKEGHKDDFLVRDYMSYTTKIGELATSYTWKSVILWDDRYREKQFEFKFRWGSDSPHLNVQLVPREKPDKTKNKFGMSKSGASTGSTTTSESSLEKRTCRYWNRNEACIRTPCRFKHACEWCGNDHRRIEHDQLMSKLKTDDKK